MFKSTYLGLIIVVSALAGCGGCRRSFPSPSRPTAAPWSPGPTARVSPRFWSIRPLSESRGGKTQYKPKIVAFFYQSDGATEMNPGPTEVKIKIGMEADARVVDLAPEAKAGRYGSAAGDYPEGFAGQIEAKLNGEAVHADVRIR